MAEDARKAKAHEAGRPHDKIHHTVTACVRCRQRKTRCDATLPRCEPCERSNAHCEYFDSTRGRTISRTYITSLQETVRKLNAELKSLDRREDYEADHESMARSAGLVKFNESDESRFLGPSSGIAITRFVMEFAKQNAARKTIKEVVPDRAAQEIKHKFDVESAKPTSKVYPLISSVAAPNLPNRDLMERLLDIYMVKAQYMLPLLHEPTFRQELDAVYSGSAEPTLNFQVRLVIAISMQKLDTQYAGLADSYYLAALPYLTDAVRKMDLSTLQCFALIGQYSLLTPTRTAAYWVVGLAAKLCQKLGLCEEETLEKPLSGQRPNVLEIDMRRRLFWIITSMEYGLSHSLGRPSAFGVSVDNINVRFFELCDDRFISPDGLLPGHHPIMKKCIAIHFLRMRLLQAEIRRTLYLKKRDTPTSEDDAWFQTMLQRIDDWVQNCPKNDEGSGLSEAWFHGRRNTMIVFMYRPSPQIPTPSFNGAKRCYDAAIFNIQLQKRQVEHRLIDVTWIFTQALFMALNTLLWSLSYPGIRQQHTLAEVNLHIDDALKGIELCADRWPGVRSAQQLYHNLIHGCLKAYENDKMVKSPATDNVSQVSTHDFSSSASQATHSPASTAATSFFGPQSPPSNKDSHSIVTSSSHGSGHTMNGYADYGNVAYGATNGPVDPAMSGQQYAFDPASPEAAPVASGIHYSLPGYDLQALTGMIHHTSQDLAQWNAAVISAGMDPNYINMPSSQMENQPWLATLGDEYSQYMGQSYAPTMQQTQTLTQQEQSELMASLEQSQLPDVSGMISDSTTFYTAHLP